MNMKEAAFKRFIWLAALCISALFLFEWMLGG